MDPSANADYAAGMLQELIGRYGNVRQALSAYNAGSPAATGTQTQWPDGQRLGYADSVMRHYDEISGDAPPPAGPAPAQLPETAEALASQSPAMPQLPAPSQPQSYHRQETDYTGLFDSDDSTTV
jgi:hypothetical protein